MAANLGSNHIPDSFRENNGSGQVCPNCDEIYHHTKFADHLAACLGGGV